ncbi:MAG: nuclear transport factor 2 family protein [Acidiferrobacterales bacterium]
MSNKKFDSPMEVEAFFYQALEQRDLSDIMAAWAEDDEVTCIHPMGPALEGLTSIRDSWGVICDSDQELSFEIDSIHYSESADIAVHIVNEQIIMAGDPPKEASILVTNVYRQTENGWRMILHHASPGSSDESAPEEPVVLH